MIVPATRRNVLRLALGVDDRRHHDGEEREHGHDEIQHDTGFEEVDRLAHLLTSDPARPLVASPETSSAPRECRAGHRTIRRDRDLM